MEKFKFISSASLISDLATGEASEFFNNHAPSTYQLDGTEEEIFAKQMNQLCSVFAMHYQNSQNKDFKTEFSRLKEKYIKYLSISGIS